MVRALLGRGTEGQRWVRGSHEEISKIMRECNLHLIAMQFERR